MFPSSSGWKFAGSDQIALSKEVLNLRLSIGVGMMMDSSKIGFDLVDMAFSLCACQIVPSGILCVLELTSYSYWPNHIFDPRRWKMVWVGTVR